ncbi:glycosyltransferase family 9 protein [soil metagenome]
MDQSGSRQPRVLVIRGGAIGDFILTLPAIRLLRDNIPQARIEILGYPSITALATAAGLADSTRQLEHSSMAKLFVPNVALDEALLTYFRSFNLVVSYLYDPDGYFRGNMERIGVKTFLEASHRVEADQGHAAEQLARPLEKLAMFLDDPAPRLLFEPDTAIPPANPVVVIHPGSGSLKKNWPVARWIQMARRLQQFHPHHQLAVVTGEAELERGITAQMQEGLQGMDFLHWDQVPLPELARRLTGSYAFIGHDSGISHLAAACGLPCLLFFGPTDPATWAPRNHAVEVHAVPEGDLSLLDEVAGWTAIERFLLKVPDKKHAPGL